MTTSTIQRYPTMTVREIVSRVSKSQWRMPELQREFVWDPSKAALLLDSILKDIGIGQLTIWKLAKGEKVEVKTKKKDSIAISAAQLILDGQQRLTCLAILMGDKLPEWCDEDNERVTKLRSKISYNVENGKFDVRNLSTERDGWILARDLFVLQDRQLKIAIDTALPKNSKIGRAHV